MVALDSRSPYMADNPNPTRFPCTDSVGFSGMREALWIWPWLMVVVIDAFCGASWSKRLVLRVERRAGLF